MGLMDELIESIVKHADYRYNSMKEELRKEFENNGLKVYFAHELTSCKRKSELRKAYPKLELELMHKPPLLLEEIVQKGVKAYLPEDVEEERIFHKVLSDTVIIGTPDFTQSLGEVCMSLSSRVESLSCMNIIDLGQGFISGFQGLKVLTSSTALLKVSEGLRLKMSLTMVNLILL